MRCPKCHFQGSRTSQTPLHNLRLPLWTFAYILTEALHIHPQVLTASSIQRRLGVSNNTATLLKRRLQLFLREFVPVIKQIMTQEINQHFGDDFRFPRDTASDLTRLTEKRPVISMDTMAIFSAKKGSNGYRKRFKHNGQTASIYLSDEVALERGKYQIGTLVHTIGIKKGPVIFDSVPDQKQRTLQPLLDFLPPNAPTFTDQGYPWLRRYNDNHRTVNHSKRAIDRKRNVWSRERWSCNGVHSQTAEGFQRVLKHSFLAGYGYIRPEYSQLYLDEWCALKGLNLYGLERLAELKGGTLCGESERPMQRHLVTAFPKSAMFRRISTILPMPQHLNAFNAENSLQ
ncbi:MAG: transposase [Spirochaetes bacterium]|nr:transposase [Spirochaetota bacterium]